ncbi:hypothetical protein SAMN05444339_11019 [Loktanella atrilutea]|uniref:Uncharacterized protein n=1 Tax=Loktanella atrilutea TaxID=366533 RepID=A0A1M5DJN9_LOKAT|nr:hypothetical protein [Loktanella atrilutea]SHF67105.1 hypothetical protein SAMN05444339_11019 [Loktanella atrilutea]
MADATPMPSRATLYPIERALVNTAVSIVTCTSYTARVLLIGRLAKIMQQVADEPTGDKMSPAEVAAIQQANDIRFGPLARIESAAARLVRLYRKDATRTPADLQQAIGELRAGISLYFIDRSDAACDAIGIPLNVPAVVPGAGDESAQCA